MSEASTSTWEVPRPLRVIGATAMGLTPIVLIVGGLLHPTEKEEIADQLVVVRAHMDQWYISHLMLMIGCAFLIPAMLMFLAPLRTRAPRAYFPAVTQIGIGAFSLFGAMAMDGMGLWGIAHASNADAAAEVGDTLDNTAISFVLGHLAFALGLGLLTAALGALATKALSRWQIVVLLIGTAAIWLYSLAGFDKGLAITFVSLAILLVPAAFVEIRGRRAAVPVQNEVAAPVAAGR